MAATRHLLVDASRSRRESIATAIAKNFEGDATLYDAFAASCRQQFSIDTSTGQIACEAGDLNTLRRLCHDLKSVLLMLGYSELSQLAAQIEKESGAEAGKAAASDDWRRLRGALLRMHLR